MIRLLAALTLIGSILAGWFALGAGLVLPGLDAVFWFSLLALTLGVLFDEN